MPPHRPASRPLAEHSSPVVPPGLPARPALRDDVPLVWRDATTLEVGDPPRSCLVPECTPEVIEWLLTLDGSADCREVLAAAVQQGIPAQHGAQVLALLDGVGALDDLGVPPPLHDAPTEHRVSLLGQSAAAALTFGSTQLASAVMSRRMRTHIEVSASGPQARPQLAELIAELLRACGVGTVTVTTRPLTQAADLHVLARVGHPDLPDDAGALALHRVHLPVVTIGARAVIGPLVDPGRTPCLRCLSLARGDDDPEWPRRAAQLMRGRRRRGVAVALDSGLIAASAAQAALMAMAWVDSSAVDEVPLSNGWRVELRLPGAIPFTHSTSFHPDCACSDGDSRIPESA